MTTEQTPSTDRDLQEARTRLTNIAVALTRLFGRDETARMLIANVIGVLGAQKAADLMGQVIIEIDRDEGNDAPTAPTN